ncbi:MAG: type II toxin-antitoxin system ParD family antitoxin [Planctomycetota bacterium]
MQEITIHLDQGDAAYAQAQVQAGRYNSPSAYVSSLIAQDAARQLDQEAIGKALDAGIRSGDPETLDETGLEQLRETMRAAAKRSAS